VDITSRLLSRIAAPDDDGANEVVLPTELIVRGSTDPSAVVA
jgi:DNA-binding LacI/PurR family transcriptional regulator